MIPTRLQTHYSILTSTVKVKEVVAEAKEAGYTSLAITDLHNIGGTVAFYQECKSQDIKPLLGIQLAIQGENSNDNTITLICKNHAGWLELLKVINHSNSGEDHPSIGLSVLQGLVTQGNFVCIDGYVGSTLAGCVIDPETSEFKEFHTEFAQGHVQKLQLIFGESDYYLEANLFEDGLSPKMTEFVRSLNCRAVAGAAVHYLSHPEDQRLLLCSKMKCKLSTAEEALKRPENATLDKFFRSDNYSLPTCSQLSDLYLESECLTLTRLVESCEEFDILSKPQLPHFATPQSVSEIDHLRQLCREGWKQFILPSDKIKNPDKKEEYRLRVEMELKIIEEADIAGYFLIVADLVNEFKSQGYLMGPGRGCFLPDTRVKMSDETHSPINFIKIGDKVIDAYGDIQEVYNTLEFSVNEEIIELEFEDGRVIRCTQNHKFLTENRGWVAASDLTNQDNVVEV